MPTDRPRIQAYLDPVIYDLLLGWKKQRGITKESEAINQILAEYFGVENSTAPAQIDPEQIRVLAAAECQAWANKLLVTINSKLEVIGIRLDTLESIVKPIEGLAELSRDLPRELPDESPELEDDAEEELPSESLQESPSENTPEEAEGDSPKEWQIEDRVRVLCASSYQGMAGTIVKYEEALGWGVHVDQWWKAAGVSESAIDERQKKASCIWCNAHEMERLEELPSDLPESHSLPADIPESLNAADLAKRLVTAKSTVSRRKEEPDFEEWSKRKDPEAIAWRYDRKNQKFIPMKQPEETHQSIL